MRRINLYRVFQFIALIIVLGCFSNSFLPQENTETPQAKKERIEAERLWEQMVKVKGGRAKLHSISNMMLVDGNRPDDIQIQLYVYPNKYWEWSKNKGLHDLMFIAMANLDLGVFMVASHQGLATDQRNLSDIKRASYGEGYLMEACAFLLETKWLQPTPIRIRQQMVGKERLDVIETVFPKLYKYRNWRQDFYVNPESLVVRGVANYSSRGNMYKYYSFDGYTRINGLDVPLKFASSFTVGEPKKTEYVALSFQFNIDYDPKLFERPPSVEAGPDAWRPKK